MIRVPFTQMIQAARLIWDVGTTWSLKDAISLYSPDSSDAASMSIHTASNTWPSGSAKARL